MSAYAELAVTTNFSFLRGASHPKELVGTAAMLGLNAIGIADRNSLAGVVRAYEAWKDMEGEKPRLLVGARLVFADGTPDLLCYPTDRAAYGRLCRLLSTGKHRAKKGECRIFFEDLGAAQEGCLFAAIPDPARHPRAGGDPEPQAPDVRPLDSRLRGNDTGVEEALAKLREMAPGRVWLAAAMLYRGDDGRRLGRLQRLARAAQVPLLAVNDVLYHEPGRRRLQDVVACIRAHVTLETAGRLLEANAERHLKPPAGMAQLFDEAPEAVAETIRFAGRIGFCLSQLKYNYPDEKVPPGKTAQRHLEDLTWAGARTAYPDGLPEPLRKTLEKELALIEKLDYAPYFLTVHDIVGFARSQGILCQGRGSAANSAVCYVLGITGVDPNAIDLLFERFISAERKEPPDIDVDFEHERREEVIQYVYERYGRAHAALTATVISYRPRSAIREVGKVFGLTEDVVGRLSSGIWGMGGESLKEKEVRQGALDPKNALIAQVLVLANELIGFPRHLSQHVGGFVLTRDALDSIVPIGPAAMEKRYFIEWDKDDIDTLGIMKVDVLALGMLTCIRKAFQLIADHEGKSYTLATVPREDPAVYDMLCKGDAIGVFQVESRAQMNMLPRLKPRQFYDLVIEVAIVRPGPIQGDMVHPYLRRRSGKERVEFPSPLPAHGPADELHQVLGRTLGVPLFQEQAMKLAIVAARFTPEEANGLRRAMATFRHVGTIHKFREKFIGNMVARGYAQDFAERCFKQIEGFGDYGFPESHAASFAHLVYISAWIKYHHPASFACALLNAQPMGFYAPAEIVRDARGHGVLVRAPDINASLWDNTLERDRADNSLYRHPRAGGDPEPQSSNERLLDSRFRGNDAEEGSAGRRLALRLGFRQIDGFSEAWAETMAKARIEAFSSPEDLMRRTGLPKRALIKLAEADGFRSLALDRREALWAVRRLAEDAPLPLFAARGELPEEETAPLPLMPLSEHVLADYETLRLSLKGYPTQFLRARFTAENIMSCAEVNAARDGARCRCAGIVLIRQMPGAKGVVFVTLSDETGIANVVVWPSVFERFRAEVMGARLMLVEGRIQKSPEGIVHIVAERFADRTGDLHRLGQDEPSASLRGDHTPRHPRHVRLLPKSRDFH
jgi:error-prone DNA polymerase